MKKHEAIYLHISKFTEPDIVSLLTNGSLALVHRFEMSEKTRTPKYFSLAYLYRRKIQQD